ncbi:hypothetical protein VTL71DRAFT_300 [Oculimacula yallundae]|uniref:Uncharacterized protein n=1 Tax=Oculimacula yallundae TaxID=86028 RepID=A0ABR4CZN4_9HELO
MTYASTSIWVAFEEPHHDLHLGSGINHTCLAVAGRKSCTKPFDTHSVRQPYSLNTTTSSKQDYPQVHFINCVRFPLYDRGWAQLHQKRFPGSGSHLHTQSLNFKICSPTPSTPP